MPATLGWLLALALTGFAIAAIDRIHAALARERALEQARRARQAIPATDA